MLHGDHVSCVEQVLLDTYLSEPVGVVVSVTIESWVGCTVPGPRVSVGSVCAQSTAQQFHTFR